MHQDDVKVRLARIDDAPQVQANCMPMNSVAEVRAHIEENLAAYAEGTRVPLVAEVAGAMVGNALLIRERHPLRRHRAVWHDIVVASTHQRRGIARRLLAETLTQAATLGIAILETSARGGEPAEEVYRHLGFREWGRLPGGLQQAWGQQRSFDEVYYFLPVESLTEVVPDH